MATFEEWPLTRNAGQWTVIHLGRWDYALATVDRFICAKFFCLAGDRWGTGAAQYLKLRDQFSTGLLSLFSLTEMGTRSYPPLNQVTSKAVKGTLISQSLLGPGLRANADPAWCLIPATVAVSSGRFSLSRVVSALGYWHPVPSAAFPSSPVPSSPANPPSEFSMRLWRIILAERSSAMVIEMELSRSSCAVSVLLVQRGRLCGWPCHGLLISSISLLFIQEKHDFRISHLLDGARN